MRQLVTKTKHLLVNGKKDVGMAKRFSKNTETRDELLTTCSPISRCLLAPDATSLPQEQALKLIWFQL